MWKERQARMAGCQVSTQVFHDLTRIEDGNIEERGRHPPVRQIQDQLSLCTSQRVSTANRSGLPAMALQKSSNAHKTLGYLHPRVPESEGTCVGIERNVQSLSQCTNEEPPVCHYSIEGSVGEL